MITPGGKKVEKRIYQPSDDQQRVHAVNSQEGHVNSGHPMILEPIEWH